MSRDKRTKRNALGGATTGFEEEFYPDFTREHSQDTLESQRGVVVRAHSTKTYDIRILVDAAGKVIKNVGIHGQPPATPYPPGREVGVHYPKGKRQPVITGGFFYSSKFSSGPGSGEDGDGGAGPNPLQEMALAAFHAIRYGKIVLADDMEEILGGSSQYQNLFPNGQIQEEVHRAVSRVTANPIPTESNKIFMCDTDGGAFLFSLPAGRTGMSYRIANVGSSGNSVSITPDGLELLLGENSPLDLLDGDVLDIVYEATEGWI